MSNTSNSAMLDQVFEPIGQCLTPEVARRIAALRAPEELQRRLDELAEKSTEGTLTADERSQYETWVRAINFLGVLQGKARKIVAAAESA
jgi:hypothetical protein